MLHWHGSLPMKTNGAPCVDRQLLKDDTCFLLQVTTNISLSSYALTTLSWLSSIYSMNGVECMQVKCKVVATIAMWSAFPFAISNKGNS